MRSMRVVYALGAAVVGLAAYGTAAQGIVPDAPQITEISPPSAQRGTTVNVTLSGQRMAGTKELLCRYSAFPEFIPPAARGVTAQVAGSGDGQVTAKLTIAPEAPPGLHDIRAATAQGITAPFYFYVSQHKQVPEKEPNTALSRANRVELPCTLAGTIDGNEDQDTFAFDAKGGDTLVFEVEGFKRFAPPQNQQQGISYLDSFLLLRDASGNEVASDDDSSRLDALLTHRISASGTYYVTLRDTLYRGRGDFHYRLSIGKQPVLTGIFPPGGPQGRKVMATLFGFNLDSMGATSIKRMIELPAPGVQEYRVTTAEGISNAVPVTAGTMEENSEVEPNERVQDATQVSIPVVCSGMFDKVDDFDGFRFQGQAGQRLLFHITASRFSSLADTYLTLKTRSGKMIGQDDDGGGMPDARLDVTLPDTDEYVVFIRNQTRTGCGPRYFYRLAIRPMQPRFSVVYRRAGVDREGRPAQVAVDSVPVPQGGADEFEVMINRAEGQDRDVSLSLNLPPNVQGLSIEQIVRTKIDAKNPSNGPENMRESTVPQPVIKSGQNTASIRIKAGPELAPGTYMNLYLKASGTAGAQPYVVNQPLWLTVVPR